ncbi:MAG: flippase-like domain-containing protein [Myxococcales bacterium FL481]|nr:MAG: flippase-like domain-containing protein [Myxococcales bacterium FL481]
MCGPLLGHHGLEPRGPVDDRRVARSTARPRPRRTGTGSDHRRRTRCVAVRPLAAASRAHSSSTASASTHHTVRPHARPLCCRRALGPAGAPNPMNRFTRRALIGVGLGILVYFGFVAYVGVRDVATALRSFAWPAGAFALLMSAGNYALRFGKWEACLGWLNVRESVNADASATKEPLSLGRSAAVYLAGLSMSVTPGKLGEVLRSVLLRAAYGLPFWRTAPIVLADRLTDLVALVLLSAWGIAHFSGFDDYLPVLMVTVAAVLTAVVVLGNPRWSHAMLRVCSKIPLVGRVFVRADEMITSSAALLTVPRLAVLTVLSVLGWGLECAGFWWILEGFGPVAAELTASVFLWSTTTLIGAVSLLPGGLGATEISLDVLLPKLTSGVTGPIAAAAILLARGCTLWFGEVVGALALVWLLRDPALRGDRLQAATDA